MHTKKLSFREAQLGALEVLKGFSALCEEHGWKYFLAYGSMLGAVRHQGIIPWDDDIDLMMPRPDYDAMREYFREHPQELLPLKLFDKTVVRKYPHMIARISDQRYHLVFDNEKDYGIGLFVDIYPLDGVGNDYSRALRLLRKTKRIASLCFLTGRKSFGVDNTRSKLKMLIKFPAFCWAKLMGNRHYIKKLTKLSATFDYTTSKYVACVCWPEGDVGGKSRDIYEKALIKELIDVPFEDTTAKIPAAYDVFLTQSYGDYMQCPPEDQRTTNHTYDTYLR